MTVNFGPYTFFMPVLGKYNIWLKNDLHVLMSVILFLMIKIVIHNHITFMVILLTISHTYFHLANLELFGLGLEYMYIYYSNKKLLNFMNKH